MSVFETLSAIDITEKIKKKNGMSYLPWSSAWQIVKSKFPDATYRVATNYSGGMKLNYFSDGRTCWVETTVKIGDEEQTEQLPVLNNRNQSISAESLTSMDVNKAIKRCLVKNCALFGLGLSLWNGEELSDNAKEARDELRAINEETYKIASEKAAESADMKKKVGDLIAGYVPNKNVKAIKNMETAKEVNAAIKKLK